MSIIYIKEYDSIHPGELFNNNDLMKIFPRYDFDLFIDYFGVKERYLLPQFLS